MDLGKKTRTRRELGRRKYETLLLFHISWALSNLLLQLKTPVNLRGGGKKSQIKSCVCETSVEHPLCARHCSRCWGNVGK